MIEKIVSEVFPDFEKWNAFIEIEEQKTKLFEFWSSGYKTKLKDKFLENFPEWKLDFPGQLEVYFYPSGFQDRKSLEIWIENGFQLSFWLNANHFDLTKAKALISKKIELIEQCLKQPVVLIQNQSDSYIFKTTLTYNLSKHVGNNWSKLIYFADKELPDEIIRIIRSMLENAEIVQLFKEINTQCIK